MRQAPKLPCSRVAVALSGGLRFDSANVRVYKPSSHLLISDTSSPASLVTTGGTATPYEMPEKPASLPRARLAWTSKRPRSQVIAKVTSVGDVARATAKL